MTNDPTQEGQPAQDVGALAEGVGAPTDPGAAVMAPAPEGVAVDGAPPAPGSPAPPAPAGAPSAPADGETLQGLLEDPATPQVLNTQNTALHDGVNRCPKCGSTDIQLRPSSGMLVCLFCRNEWSEAGFEAEVQASGDDISQLTGTIVGSGASDIDASVSDVVTLKCQGCGSEVVVNTAGAMAARCHWCRHVLTINDQIANGAVPDALLPFSVTHDQAVERIQAFAAKRRTFANRRFLAEFAPDNVLGVYLPYMVVDGNVSADTVGTGEIETRSYTRGSDDDKTTYYDADVYRVERHVDFTVDDLTIESSQERANMNVRVNTNNIINAILPFDTKNAVRWNANYLTGFTSEKRDQDVSGLQPVLEDQLLSIARSQVQPSVSGYDRGVRWEAEHLEIKGTRWVAMYLPVWLYSYYQQETKMVHYIAVNGRTGQTMGSVPVSQARMFLAAAAVGTAVEAAVIAFLVATS